MSRLRRLAHALALAAALFVALVPVCAFALDGQMPTSWDDFAGARVALITGAPFEATVREKCPEVGEILFFDATPDVIAAAQTDKVDAFVHNQAVGTLASNRYDDLELFPEVLYPSDMGVAFPKGSEWSRRFAAITERMRTDGTADELWEKWTSSDDAAKTVPEQDWPGSNGTLKVAACQSMEPISYMAEGGFLGYDIETLLLAAKELDVHLDFTPVEFAEILAFLQSGKADIGCGSILITDERQQAMDFATTHENNLVVVVHVGSQAQAVGGEALEISTVEEVPGKRIGLVVGTSFDRLLFKNYEGISEGDLSYFNSVSEMVGALKANKIDLFVIDLPIAQLAVNRNSGIGFVSEPLFVDHYGFALPKGSPLTAQLNERIAKMREDGSIDAIYQKWTGADEAAKVMPVQDWEAPNGTLEAVVSGEGEPSSYGEGSDAKGFSNEILVCIARELGYRVEFRVVPFPTLIAELQSGRADVGVSLLSITDERKQSVDMTDPYLDGGAVAVVRTVQTEAKLDGGFFGGISTSFQRTFITENRWKLILSGLGVTVLITLLSGAFGTALGFATVLLRRRGNRLANAFVGAFEGLMGRLPIVVVLMVFYYVIFGSIDIPSVIVATIVFTLAFGASVGSIMWNAVQSVDGGQAEASLALGFNDNQTFFGVVLPQAARRFLPLLSGQLVSLAKDTSVVGYIAVQDLTRVGDLIRSRTMEAFFPLLATATIYFVLCCLLAWAMGLLIKRLDLERRPRIIKGVQL